MRKFLFYLWAGSMADHESYGPKKQLSMRKARRLESGRNSDHEETRFRSYYEIIYFYSGRSFGCLPFAGLLFKKRDL